ncbi:MAG: helix-turn-helix domain-containing protein [Desulfobacula sp.]|jgi:AcrR family transcriptional regulator
MIEKRKLKVRDRQITCRRLISAVGSILAKKGFKGVGVNAVAREAGVDKVLIYRYFNGLEGLVAAFGKEGDFWPSSLEMAGGDIYRFSQMPFEERLSAFGVNFIKSLKKRPVTQAIMAWELIETNELTDELERVREESIIEFFQMFFIKDNTKKTDLQAIVALIGAGISYLVLRSKNIDFYGGIEISSEKGWSRLQEGMDQIVKGLTGLL